MNSLSNSSTLGLTLLSIGTTFSCPAEAIPNIEIKKEHIPLEVVDFGSRSWEKIEYFEKSRGEALISKKEMERVSFIEIYKENILIEGSKNLLSGIILLGIFFMNSWLNIFVVMGFPQYLNLIILFFGLLQISNFLFFLSIKNPKNNEPNFVRA